jgi:hypothetical protein
MKNYTFDELEKASELFDKSTHTPDEVAYLYNLYNRIFKTNKQPGCGKCFVNVRRHLKQRFNAERGY